MITLYQICVTFWTLIIYIFYHYSICLKHAKYDKFKQRLKDKIKNIIYKLHFVYLIVKYWQSKSTCR